MVLTKTMQDILDKLREMIKNGDTVTYTNESNVFYWLQEVNSIGLEATLDKFNEALQDITY